MKTRFMALSPNHFGFGATKGEAKRNLLKFGGDRKRSGLYEVPMKYWLDDFGHAHGEATEAKIARLERENEQLRARL